MVLYWDIDDKIFNLNHLSIVLKPKHDLEGDLPLNLDFIIWKYNGRASKQL